MITSEFVTICIRNLQLSISEPQPGTVRFNWKGSHIRFRDRSDVPPNLNGILEAACRIHGYPVRHLEFHFEAVPYGGNGAFLDFVMRTLFLLCQDRESVQIFYLAEDKKFLRPILKVMEERLKDRNRHVELLEVEEANKQEQLCS